MQDRSQINYNVDYRLDLPERNRLCDEETPFRCGPTVDLENTHTN